MTNRCCWRSRPAPLPTRALLARVPPGPILSAVGPVADRSFRLVEFTAHNSRSALSDPWIETWGPRGRSAVLLHIIGLHPSKGERYVL